MEYLRSSDIRHPAKFRLRNATRGILIAERLFIARSLRDRTLGLLARPPLGTEEALRIDPCGGIHTWAMRYPIDVLFLDGNLVVQRVVRDLRPWRLALAPRGTRSVVELPAGAAGPTREGDRLIVEREA